MSLSQFEEAVGHWRGADGGPAETRRHGGEIVASIEAVGEFGQVAGDVLLADGPLGGGDGGLDVAERGIDPLEGGCLHRQRCSGSHRGEFEAGDPALALRQVGTWRGTECAAAPGRGEIVPPSAGRALVEVAGLDDAVLLPAAAGADKAARPAPAKHSLPAPIRASVKFIEARLAEPFLKLNAIARHASTPPASARVHDLCQMPAG